MKPRILFNRLIPPIKPLEKKLLDTLANELVPEAKSLLAKQILQINFVQRHSKHKEVNFYRIYHGKPSFDENLLFPISLPEVKFAVILFKVAGFTKTFRADFWIVKGHLFSIDFNQSPKGINPEDIEIKEVKVLVDPMLPIKLEPRKPIEKDVLTGWLREWAQKFTLRKMKEPFSLEQREKIIMQLDAKLPNDYLELVSQTEGMEIENERNLILGLSEIHDVVTNEANYYVLAEMQGRGLLAVKRESTDSEIYFLPYEDKEPFNQGTSIRAAIEQQMKN